MFVSQVQMRTHCMSTNLYSIYINIFVKQHKNVLWNCGQDISQEINKHHCKPIAGQENQNEIRSS